MICVPVEITEYQSNNLCSKIYVNVKLGILLCDFKKKFAQFRKVFYFCGT